MPAEAGAQELDAAENLFEELAGRLGVARGQGKVVATRQGEFIPHSPNGWRKYIFIRIHLDGTGKYDRPNLYSAHFQNVPWFGKDFENIKMDPLEPVTRPATYDVVNLMRDGSLSVVETKDRTDGHVRDVHAVIDQDGLRQVQWSYENGGVIWVDINPVEVDGYPVPQSEDADIQVPGYHVTAHAEFDSYKLTTDTP